MRYPRGIGFYRRALIAEDEVAPEALGPCGHKPAKALRARCGLLLTITVCVQHTSAARAFQLSGLSHDGNVISRQVFARFGQISIRTPAKAGVVVRALSSRLKARRKSTDSLHACGSARRDTGEDAAAVLR